MLLKTQQRRERCELQTVYCEILEGVSDDLAKAEKETDRCYAQIISLCYQLGPAAPSLEEIRAYLSDTMPRRSAV